jgi:hypothetical protein
MRSRRVVRTNGKFMIGLNVWAARWFGPPIFYLRIRALILGWWDQIEQSELGSIMQVSQNEMYAIMNQIFATVLYSGLCLFGCFGFGRWSVTGSSLSFMLQNTNGAQRIGLSRN